MSYEVIIDVSDIGHASYDFKSLFGEVIPTKERIVRCRYCRYASAGEAVISGNWKLGNCLNPRFRGSIHGADVTANCFCAWGEKKVDA